MIVHTIHTLKIKDYILFDETDDISHLCRFKFLKRFSLKGIEKLKDQIVKKFALVDQDSEDEYNELKLYFYFQVIYFRSMYFALKERNVSELIDAFKIAFRVDFSVDKLHLIIGKAEYFEGKYKNLVEKREKKEGKKTDWTLIDEISQIESILGINIDRNQPIFAIKAYRKRVSEKLKAFKDGKGH